MSGHSKWSKIKRAKGAADINRGQLFTKLTREIIIAVREGGSNPESNFRLRLAIQKARDHNMPTDNIERAIKRGSGELGGATLVELVLEGYGPGGTAVLVQALSDNRNRTVQDVRNIFSRNGGNLGESGGVAWLFVSRGVIAVEAAKNNIDPDELSLQAIDAGAEDIKVESGYVEIYTRPNDLETVRAALKENKVPVASAEIQMVPKTMVELEEKHALQMLRLMERLEELDEVQNVATNADFAPEVVEKYQAGVSLPAK